MFTGLVSEIGKVKGVSRVKGVARLEISCKKTAEGANIGDSIAVNGACLSVVNIKNGLAFDVVGNTLERTNLKRLKTGSLVNLEKALRAGDTLGGHFVSGHIDGERAIKKIEQTGNGWVLDVESVPDDRKYLVPRGSVTIDGVSLTVGAVEKNYFRIFIIPHTIKNTALLSKKNGGYVNVEFDMTAKYAINRSSESSITREFLADQGFI